MYLPGYTKNTGRGGWGGRGGEGRGGEGGEGGRGGRGRIKLTEGKTTLSKPEQVQQQGNVGRMYK